MRPIVMGYAATCYGMVRVSHGLPLTPHGISYRRVRRLPLHRLPLTPPYWVNRYSFFPRPTVDALHFFNGVCTARVPWVSSIEMEYPRYFGNVGRRAREEALGCMSNDWCRLLLPMSEAARHHVLSRIDDRLRDRIESKTVVFRGGVAIPEEALRARREHLAQEGAPFTIAFVGKWFWHKGGPAVLEAAQTLRERGADLRLLLVSELWPRSHVADPGPEQIAQVRETIAAADWIEYHPRLPNHEVLVRMAGCDALAFPSFDESLGWVAIEALGLGLPVVASNAFALPEIVEHGVQGLLVELPLNADRRWKGIADLNPAPRPTYQDTHETVVDGCVRAFDRLLSDAGMRRRMGEAARHRFESLFSEDAATRRLSALLRDALA